MAATNGQVAKRSLADSGISAAGFLSGPEESACSLSNWITGLFPHFKGLWTQQRSCMMKSKWQLKWEGEKQQEFLKSPLASARQLTREMRNQWSLLRRVTGISFQWCEIRERSASRGRRGKHHSDLLERRGNNVKYQKSLIFYFKRKERKLLTAMHLYLWTNMHISYGRSTEGSRGGAHSIQNPVVTLGDYFQILSNELSISVPPPPSQPFQLSNRFYITFCTTSQGAMAKTNACEKYDRHTSGVWSSHHSPAERGNNVDTVQSHRSSLWDWGKHARWVNQHLEWSLKQQRGALRLSSYKFCVWR